MSTLRINNIEAQSVPASPTIDEKVKVTNSSGDILVNIDGKTSGITTIGINTTDGNIKFDANSNVLITGILTATTLAGNFTPDSLEIGSNIKLGNAGVITATSFVGSGTNLTGIDTDLVSDTSPQLGGDLASNSHDILFADNDKAIFGAGSDFKIYHNGSHNYLMASNGDYVFDTGSAELARLKSNGKVGIGVNDPDAKLEVLEDIYVKGSSGDGSTGIQIRSGSSALSNQHQLRTGGGLGNMLFLEAVGTNSALSIKVAGSERLGISSTGVVNIGAASPAASENGQLNIFTTTSGGKVQFVHSAGAGGVRLAGTAGGSGASLVFSNNYNSGTFSDHWTIQHDGSNDSLKFLSGGTGGTERLRIDSSGRLLVGAAAIQYHSVPFYASGTDPVIAAFHHSDGGTNDQARISLGALANNPPYNRGVNLVGLNNGNGHDFVVQCSASHSAGPGEKVRVRSGGGLTFNGDTAAANALDDYEEGSFTLTAAPSSSGTLTLNSSYNKGVYTKVGNLVKIQAYLSISGNSNATGYVQLSSLPFTVDSNQAQASGHVRAIQVVYLNGQYAYLPDGAGYYNAQLYCNEGQTWIRIYDLNGSGRRIDTIARHLSGGADLFLNFSYLAA